MWKALGRGGKIEKENQNSRLLVQTLGTTVMGIDWRRLTRTLDIQLVMYGKIDIVRNLYYRNVQTNVSQNYSEPLGLDKTHGM